ncbi:MAG: SEC-C domain-containing protein, partial [Thermoanaerobaculia bacterium]|nr:SEC-C domain-containing protein [Thermoanaerobaculia bacterium]
MSKKRRKNSRKPRRNGPCPCGSGNSFKRCCLEALAEERRSGEGWDFEERSAAPRIWQADVVVVEPTWKSSIDAEKRALQASLEDDDATDERSLGMAIVCAEGLILERRLRRGRRADAQEVATDLALCIRSALDAGASPPSEVCVRFESLVAPLMHSLADTGIQVVVSRTMEGLDQVVVTLDREDGSFRDASFSPPASWADLDLPDVWIGQFYKAAASVQTAQLRRRFDEREAVEIKLAGRPAWWVSIGGGLEDGTPEVHLYERRHDLLDALGRGSGPVNFGGKRIVVHFVDRASLPAAMEREVDTAGWASVGSDVYPLLIPSRTLAGGLSAQDARDLLAILQILGAQNPEIERMEKGHLGWKDAPSGARVSWLPRHEDQTSLWAEPRRLDPGFARGAGAEPAARGAKDSSLFDDLAATDDAFEIWLSRRLSPRLARRHLDGASYFITYLAQYLEVPLRAIHELDLRSFLFDWYPNSAMVDDREASRVPESLRLFFEFLAAEFQIECPWATTVLAERRVFHRRWLRSEMRSIWQVQEETWKRVFHQHLEDRLLVPCDRMSDGGSWSTRRTWRNASLERELQELWLQWRDELLEGVENSGDCDREQILEQLLKRQRRW